MAKCDKLDAFRLGVVHEKVHENDNIYNCKNLSAEADEENRGDIINEPKHDME